MRFLGPCVGYYVCTDDNIHHYAYVCCGSALCHRNKMLLVVFSPVVHFLFHWGFPALDLTSMFLHFARIIIFDKDFIYHIVCERIMLKWNLVQKLLWSVCTPVFQNCTCSSFHYMSY